MQIKITDDSGDEQLCTFDEFLAANDWTPDERADWLATLSSGDSFYIGGGAAAAFLIEPATPHVPARNLPEDTEGVGYAAGYASACGY